ncbi:MAG: hypothetical protein H6816_16115 [Phycisphaerales bacterium]|nr:hypothetical protein [Phycisphaerales bacterium]
MRLSRLIAIAGSLLAASSCGGSSRTDQDTVLDSGVSTDAMADSSDSEANVDAGADATSEASTPDASSVWAVAAQMPQARAGHTSALVGGAVIVAAGGDSFQSLVDALSYDPTAGSWTPAKDMPTARGGHCAVVLPDGRLLIAGGIPVGGMFTSPTAATEIFDPKKQDWAPPGSGMNQPRHSHECALLPGGAVLAAGGFVQAPPLPVATASTEVFEPSKGWTMVAPMLSERIGHTATSLPDGRVLIAGGADKTQQFLATAEVFDPKSGGFIATGSLAVPRAEHRAVALQDGNVLVVGGWSSLTDPLYDAELYDPAQGTWSAAGSMAVARTVMTVTLLPSGKVLVIGGNDAQGPVASAELFDPSLSSWSSAGAMAVARADHAAALLPSGQVLVTGGWTTGVPSPTNSAELFDPSAL